MLKKKNRFLRKKGKQIILTLHPRLIRTPRSERLELYRSLADAALSTRFAKKLLRIPGRFELRAASGLSCIGAWLTLRFQFASRFGSSNHFLLRNKQRMPLASFVCLAGALRFELRRTVLETAMLPLHHAPIRFDERYYSTNGNGCQALFLYRVSYCADVRFVL